MPEWTVQQQAFFDFLSSTDDSCVLRACAGSGKTTTLVEGIKHLRGSVLAVAFNVKIKKEFETRIGKSAVCKTMNGLGHRALMNMHGSRIIVERDKMFKIIADIVGDDKSLRQSWGAASQLVSRAKHAGLVPKGTPGQWKSFTEDTRENWEALALNNGIIFDDDVLTLARKALRKSNTMSWQGTCDFDDQIYVPCCWEANFDKYENIIVDEAQDLSILQHKILRKSLKRGGRLIAAGDPNQAIYGWRAAASNSIDLLTEEFDLKHLMLTVSFRCGSRIIEEAQYLVPEIEARPGAQVGAVFKMGRFGPDTFEQGDVILCRNNGPIVALAYKLIREGVPCFVIGRDIGRGLKNLIKKLQKQHSFNTVDALTLAVAEWKEVEGNRLIATKKFSQVQAVYDKAESLLAILHGNHLTSLDAVERKIDSLFSRTTGKVALSTVHRAKGLEWQRVFFLDQHLIPSVWAQKAMDEDPERLAWMMQEEHNIEYVAITRAIDGLIYITSEGWNAE